MTEKNIWISYIPNDEHILSALDDAQSSSISSLTNPNKLENPTSSVVEKRTSHNTIKGYLDYVEDVYLFQSAKRGNVKGRKYFDTLQEYYAMDLGLKNACLTFRQQERSLLMEYMIYNELIRRGYSVDVGVVEITRVIEGKHKQSQYEIEVMNSLRLRLRIVKSWKPTFLITDGISNLQRNSESSCQRQQVYSLYLFRYREP